MQIPAKLKSRKFWLALAGVLLPILAQYFTAQVGWDIAVEAAVVVLVSYLLGQSHVDAHSTHQALHAVLGVLDDLDLDALDAVLDAVPDDDEEEVS